MREREPDLQGLEPEVVHHEPRSREASRARTRPAPPSARPRVRPRGVPAEGTPPAPSTHAWRRTHGFLRLAGDTSRVPSALSPVSLCTHRPRANPSASTSRLSNWKLPILGAPGGPLSRRPADPSSARASVSRRPTSLLPRRPPSRVGPRDAGAVVPRPGFVVRQRLVRLGNLQKPRRRRIRIPRVLVRVEQQRQRARTPS